MSAADRESYPPFSFPLQPALPLVDCSESEYVIEILSHLTCLIVGLI